MEEAGGGGGFSPLWRRYELWRLRRLRRRLSSSPLPARRPPGDGTPPAARRSAAIEPVAKGERLPGAPDTCSHLCFWRRIAGIAVAVAVILLLWWITLNPPKLPQLEPCPDDWLYYKKKCYYHSGATADWSSSQEFCSDYGASLAVIDSRQELNFIMY
ncbi:C-type lectin domain family 2 member L-like [Opisthocomus hoazin]|uniref:C-type lectin domain family 2 member L-like n=1 Tax=Opisthocomus hoazin TaxID=30419 RepID=UPI003F5292FB